MLVEGGRRGKRRGRSTNTGTKEENDRQKQAQRTREDDACRGKEQMEREDELRRFEAAGPARFQQLEDFAELYKEAHQRKTQREREKRSSAVSKQLSGWQDFSN
jgi:hypothetical protein